MASARGTYQRGKATREQIIESAREIVRERGVHRTSIPVIAERVGLTRAGVMYHFPTREHLLVATMEDRFTENKTWFDAELKAGRCVLDVCVDQLRRVVAEPEWATLLIVVLGASIEPDHPAHSWAVERYRLLRALAVASVRHDQERGFIKPELSPEAVAAQLVALLEGLLLQWLNDPSFADITEIAEAQVASLRGPAT